MQTTASRRDELNHRMDAAKRKLDVRAQIVRHPLPSVGIAFGLGLIVGVGLGARRGARAVRVQARSRRDAVLALLGAFALRLLKDAALGQASELAKRWWDHRTVSPSEAHASRMSDLEPFLEH